MATPFPSLHLAMRVTFPAFALFLSACPSKGSNQLTEPPPGVSEPMPEISAFERALLDLVNLHRMQRGLIPLEINNTAMVLADEHSIRMASRIIPMGHEGFRDRVDAINKVLPTASAAENVVQSSCDEKVGPGEALQLWLGSPGHRRNIEEASFTHTGIGTGRTDRGTCFVTQIYLARMQ